MRSQLMVRPRSIVHAVTGSAALFLGIAHGAPTVGSPNTATADPPITVPNTTPCVVPLFAGVAFADFSPKPFAYAVMCLSNKCRDICGFCSSYVYDKICVAF